MSVVRMVKKKCEHCGTLFNVKPATLKKGKGKYCSRECLSVAKDFGKRMTATCDKCGRVFQHRPSDGTRKYCSTECYQNIRPKIKKVCKICGTDFEIQPHRVEHGNGIYCSRECFGISRHGMTSPTKGIPSPFRGIPRCEETKRKISESHRRLKKAPHKKSIDALVAYNKSLRGKPGRKHTEETKRKLSRHFKGLKRPEILGEKHPNWRGGVAYQPYCEKFNSRFKKRARAFFKNKCIICGKTKQENINNLSVHHVQENKNTCCDDSVPLFVLLCIPCHRLVHTRKDDAWAAYFENTINNRFGGKCYYTEEEWMDLH